MKHVFRIGYILVPFLFFLSTTANSAEKHAQKHQSRSPSSVSEKSQMDLSRLSAWNHGSQGLTTPTHQVQMASGVQPVTPPIGRGLGVAAPVLRFE